MSKAHSRRLEAKARRIQGGLAILANDRVWRELIPIWRRPGWTTPAEFYLVSAALDGMLAQTKVLAGMRQMVLRGSRAVKSR
jgi:hypothetical protein